MWVMPMFEQGEVIIRHCTASSKRVRRIDIARIVNAIMNASTTIEIMERLAGGEIFEGVEKVTHYIVSAFLTSRIHKSVKDIRDSQKKIKKEKLALRQKLKKAKEEKEE